MNSVDYNHPRDSPSPFSQPFHPGRVPEQFQSPVSDIGWFGILNGSALAFLAVYATRLGASGYQIGLLGAMTAAVNLLIAMPAGQWLHRQPGMETPARRRTLA